MAIIQTSAPIFYSNGAQGASYIVGYEGGRIRIARYSFIVPSGVSASKISVNFGQIGKGDGSPSVSFKINQDPNSYANALGFNADGAVEAYYDGGRYYARVSGGNIEINTTGTYYLWLFPANSEFGYWAWNSNDLSLDLTEARTYRLNLNQSAHSTLQVKRNGTLLGNGATLYLNDILTVTFSANAGYKAAATLNGAPITSGYTHTVTGDVSIAVTAEIRKYELSISAGTGSSITVNRTSSPVGSTGNLANGSTIYHGDQLQITFTAQSTYEIDTHTVNGSVFTSGSIHTVAAAVSVVATAKRQGLIYLDTGTQFEAAQIFIDNGSEWEQYMPYIDSGSEFELYT